MQALKKFSGLAATLLGGMCGAALVLGGYSWLTAKREGPLVLEGDYRALVAEADRKQVKEVMIVRKGCPACARAEKWLDERNHVVSRISLDDEQAIAAMMLERVESPGTPTLITETMVIVGFHPDVWEAQFPAVAERTRSLSGN